MKISHVILHVTWRSKWSKIQSLGSIRDLRGQLNDTNVGSCGWQIITDSWAAIHGPSNLYRHFVILLVSDITWGHSEGLYHCNSCCMIHFNSQQMLGTDARPKSLWNVIGGQHRSQKFITVIRCIFNPHRAGVRHQPSRDGKGVNNYLPSDSAPGTRSDTQ